MLIHSFRVHRRDGEHTLLNTLFRKGVLKAAPRPLMALNGDGLPDIV